MKSAHRIVPAVGLASEINPRKWIGIVSLLGPVAFAVGAMYALPFMCRRLGWELSLSLFFLVVGVGPLLLHVLIAQWFRAHRRILCLVLLLVGTRFALSLIPVQIGRGPGAQTVGGLETLQVGSLISELFVGIAWLALAGVFVLIERAVRLAYEALVSNT